MHISTIKKDYFLVLAIFVSFIIQSIFLFLFKSRLGHTLPTRFNLNGTVSAVFQYKTSILLPGILFLLLLHIGSFIIYRFLPAVLNRIPLITNYVKNAKYIATLLCWYIESLSWVILLYFFTHTTLPMLWVNILFLLLLFILTIHKVKKAM
ncbi:hypothetical protein LB941_08840 [Ligilactobacillus sp. WILCCON 0076]|uniref:Uncharacterized protein n=1 Tax=Ligilactobacillus ubinensis TaxID=2876789 RepID=A0A9X2FKT7_9LACO|nr:hypothetical protein [Ligilactobacillus ubinensis]MCP0887441.1 hypothetical protein [Ligilactobacillus ubinensis]